MSVLYGVIGFIFFVIEMVSYQIGFYFADLWYKKSSIYSPGAVNCHRFNGSTCADYEWHMLYLGFGLFFVDFILLLIFLISFHKTRKAKPGFLMLFVYVVPSVLFHLNFNNGLELANLAGIILDVSLIIAALLIVGIYRLIEKTIQKLKTSSIKNRIIKFLEE